MTRRERRDLILKAMVEHIGQCSQIDRKTLKIKWVCCERRNKTGCPLYDFCGFNGDVEATTDELAIEAKRRLDIYAKKAIEKELSTK